jgi:hypothetical protein
LAAWVEKLSAGTFWAYHASSAPVQAVYDFWTFFEPIRKGMPQNCSTDLARVVDYIDEQIAAKNTTEVTRIRSEFGLLHLLHEDDFVMYVRIYDQQERVSGLNFS